MNELVGVVTYGPQIISELHLVRTYLPAAGMEALLIGVQHIFKVLLDEAWAHMCALWMVFAICRLF